MMTGIPGERRGFLPRIGDRAPNFCELTTHGEIDFYDWKGDSWVLLFSHPADFTPVCSTELVEFARCEGDFAERNTKIIGLSIDSIHSHLAWVENLKSIMGVQLAFPLIADARAQVAGLYGMIHPNESTTATVRALYVIDPNHRIRALIYYPLNVGRNVNEVLRLLDALQIADQKGLACPVNWQVGDKLIVPPPKTVQEVESRKQSDYERLDFYLCKTDA